jgi:hypothetical protein
MGHLRHRDRMLIEEPANRRTRLSPQLGLGCLHVLSRRAEQSDSAVLSYSRTDRPSSTFPLVNSVAMPFSSLDIQLAPGESLSSATYKARIVGDYILEALARHKDNDESTPLMIAMQGPQGSGQSRL